MLTNLILTCQSCKLIEPSSHTMGETRYLCSFYIDATLNEWGRDLEAFPRSFSIIEDEPALVGQNYFLRIELLIEKAVITTEDSPKTAHSSL